MRAEIEFLQGADMGAFRSNAANFFPVRARVRSVMGRSYLEQLADFFFSFSVVFLRLQF